MTSAIWKFPIGFHVGSGLHSAVEMPVGAKLLSVQLQGRDLCAWALVDEHAPRETRFFKVYGTGHPIERAERLTYVVTVHDDHFVWHVFELDQPA